MIFGMMSALRSLTNTPITRALNEVDRMARRYREAGGAITSTATSNEPRNKSTRSTAPGIFPAPGDFVIPADIDVSQFAAAIGGGGETEPPMVVGDLPITTASDGRSFVRKGVVAGIGAGDLRRGRNKLDRAIADLRVRRFLQRRRR